MLVGIDANEANVEKRVGIGEYAFEMLENLSQIQDSRLKTEDLQFRIYLKEKQKEQLPKEQVGWKYRVVGPKKFWTQIGLPFDLFTHNPKPDVFLTLTHYAPRFCPCPSVVSIMDLSYLFYPELFRPNDLYQLKNWTSYSVRKAKKVVTISQSSKNDIIKQYAVPSEKVAVVYPGIKQESGSMNQKSSIEDLKKKHKITGNFILFVGTLQPRKNIERLIEAFSKIAPHNKDLQLVIVGKKGWLYEQILEAPKKFGVQEDVRFLDFISNEELPALYQAATCFVLPSLYEGFGLPVLEAMKYGCPVATSNISSLPEAGGDAALYFDPKDTSDIAEKIHRLVSDEKLREEFREKGFKQVKKFSWNKAASQLLEIVSEARGKST